MNKKYKVLMIAAASVALVAGSLFAVGSSGGFLQLEASRAIKTHTITFEKNDVTVHEFDDDLYALPITLSKKDCIDDADDNTYDLTSTYAGYDSGWFGTYVYGAVDDKVILPQENEDFLFQFSSASYTGSGFHVEFSLLNRASFDYDKSVIDAKVDGVYSNVKFSVDTEGAEYTSYSAYFNTASNYGVTIEITSVKLVFSCER